MKRWAILCFLSVFPSLFAIEDDCLCGTVANDRDYARALFLLNLAIQNTPFGLGVDFPDAAGEFYPPIELRLDLEDHYPFEGQICWDVAKRSLWDKSVLENEDGVEHYLTQRTYVEVPIKIVRTIKWTDYPNYEVEYEHREKKVFNFQKNYGVIPQAFRVLKNDIEMYHAKSELFLDARMRDLSNKTRVYEWGGLAERLTKRKTLLERKHKVQLACREWLNFTDQKEAEAFTACIQSLDWCIANHHNPQAHVNRGLFYYLEGNAVDALGHVEAALEKLKNDDFEKLKEEAMFLKGQAELEAGLYADAVLTLSELIEQNPVNKEAYFERASAYFELGNFDLSLADYLSSEVKPQPISTDSVDMVSFSIGLTKGILQGGAQAGVEFIPSLLSSLQGIGHGLWAFAQDPVQMSKTFVQASQDCINFIREHAPQETLAELVPELKELIEKWDELEDEKKGEITGHVIGKYGVDIFAGAGVVKGMRLYRDLKRANNLLTFEAMAISERNKSIIKVEAIKKAQIRKELLQHANLKIQWDKQGKHVQDHVNFQASRNRSILDHQDPQKLIDNFAGKGKKVGNESPGVPGFTEIVNFEEFIGFDIDSKTGEKLATTWGKIHYAKDGTHIVPTKPR